MRTIWKTLASLALAVTIAVPTALVVAAPAQADTANLTVSSNKHNFEKKRSGAFVMRVVARHDSGYRMKGRAWVYVNGERIGAKTLKAGAVRVKVGRNKLPNHKTSTVQVRIAPYNDAIAHSTTKRNVIDRGVRVASSSPSSRGDRVAAEARRQVGDRYVWGKAGPSSFDCSGLVVYAFRQALGKRIPHNSGMIRHIGRTVPRSSIRPGDILWTRGHVSIYIGGGRVVEAATPKTGVHITRIWQRNPVVIRAW